MVLYNVQSAFKAACPAKMLQSKAAAALRGSAPKTVSVQQCCRRWMSSCSLGQTSTTD